MHRSDASDSALISSRWWISFPKRYATIGGGSEEEHAERVGTVGERATGRGTAAKHDGLGRSDRAGDYYTGELLRDCPPQCQRSAEL